MGDSAQQHRLVCGLFCGGRPKQGKSAKDTGENQKTTDKETNALFYWALTICEVFTGTCRRVTCMRILDVIEHDYEKIRFSASLYLHPGGLLFHSQNLGKTS